MYRMTRNATSALPNLRSKNDFNWFQVLAGDPEKILKKPRQTTIPTLKADQESPRKWVYLPFNYISRKVQLSRLSLMRDLRFTFLAKNVACQVLARAVHCLAYDSSAWLNETQANAFRKESPLSHLFLAWFLTRARWLNGSSFFKWFFIDRVLL